MWWRIVAGIVLFGTAFGYVEAAVVAYLRAIYSPYHAHYYPSAAADDLFPLLTLDQLHEMGPEHETRLKIELGRELATILMLAGAAMMAGRNMREWFAIFVACFGVWDITFYLGLKVLLHWPASLMTWDLLFLLPIPWVGPVVAPVVVAGSMIAMGLLILWREYQGDPIRIGWGRWVVIVIGWVVVFVAFTADVVNTTRGGYPNTFQWILFWVGEVAWFSAFLAALRRPEAMIDGKQGLSRVRSPL
jgi:hypothetical protein